MPIVAAADTLGAASRGRVYYMAHIEHRCAWAVTTGSGTPVEARKWRKNVALPSTPLEL